MIILYKFEKEQPYTIEKVDDYYVIHGDEIEKLFKMTKFNSEEGMLRFAKKLRTLGIDDELEKILNRVAQEGDYFTTLNILTEDFRYAISHGGN